MSSLTSSSVTLQHGVLQHSWVPCFPERHNSLRFSSVTWRSFLKAVISEGNVSVGKMRLAWQRTPFAVLCMPWCTLSFSESHDHCAWTPAFSSPYSSHIVNSHGTKGNWTPPRVKACTECAHGPVCSRACDTEVKNKKNRFLNGFRGRMVKEKHSK